MLAVGDGVGGSAGLSRWRASRYRPGPLRISVPSSSKWLTTWVRIVESLYVEPE